MRARIAPRIRAYRVPAAWLWLVPLAMTFSWHRGQLERFFRPVLLVVFAYQAALALRDKAKAHTQTGNTSKSERPHAPNLQQVDRHPCARVVPFSR